MTPAQSSEALRRESLVLRARALMSGEEQLSLNKAADRLGVPSASLCRYLRAYDEAGFDGLIPKQTNSGAKSVREKLVEELGEEKVAEVETKVAALALDLDGRIDAGAPGKGRVSDGLAWRTFARTADCPPAIRDYFAEGQRRSKHTIAPSLREVTRTGPLLAAKHRGDRTYRLAGPFQPRRLDILPGDIFSSDDTTPIWAWWVPWPKSPKYPHGVKLLQGQFLPVIDVASQHILAYALIAREQSSYRAADIWRLMGRVHTLVGLPRLGWQKERGSWEAQIIDGVEVTVGEDEATHSQRVGGLRMLPANLTRHHVEAMGVERAAQFRNLRTYTSYLPKSKSVEGIFQRLQKFEGTLWGTLGRSQQRRPFEKTKKLYEACRDGRADPRLHFLSGTELMHRLNACIEMHEAETIEGEVFRGKPPETWARGLQEHGELLPQPAHGAWLMCADWSLVTIKQGMARVRRVDEATGLPVSYFYAHPDFLGRLDGRSVLVYFNRDAFESPAHVLLPSASGNHEYVGPADHVSRVGMFLDGDVDGFELRKRQSGIVTTLYSDLAAYLPSRQVPAEIAQRRQVAMAMESRFPGGAMVSSDSRPADPARSPISDLRPQKPVFDEAAELARIDALEATQDPFAMA